MSERQEKYKNEGKTNELRRRRMELAVEIRKSKQEDKFSKRRFLEEEIVLPTIHSRVNMDELKDILSNLPQNDLQMLETNVGIIRRSLTVQNPPIDLVLQSGALQMLIRCLTCSERPTLQYETAWVLTNIASGDSRQTQTLIDAGAVPVLITLLGSDILQTRNQALWALGNISGDCAEFRDFCVDSGIVQPLLNVVNVNAELSTLRICAWAISNLCRYKKPIPRVEVIQAALPYIKTLLYVNDTNVVSDALWAVLYIGDAHEKYTPLIPEMGLIPILASLLATENKEYVPQILRIVGNISFLDDVSYSQILIDHGLLDSIKLLMSGQTIATRKDAIWVVSNIAAGCKEHIGCLIDSGCVEIVYEKLKTDKLKVKCEALWVIKNILADGTHDQVMYIMAFDGLIKLISELLTNTDKSLQSSTLECVYSLLRASRMVGLYDQIYIEFEHLGILDILEDLQTSLFKSVANLSGIIISEFFDGYLTDECEEVPMEE